MPSRGLASARGRSGSALPSSRMRSGSSHAMHSSRKNSGVSTTSAVLHSARENIQSARSVAAGSAAGTKTSAPNGRGPSAETASAVMRAVPSRSQLRQYSDHDIERNHKEYLLVLELIQQCLDLPPLRDVALRSLATRFVSRYRVLDSIADARTEAFRYRPAFLHRVLLSQASALFKLLATELQQVHEFAESFRQKLRDSQTSANALAGLDGMSSSAFAKQLDGANASLLELRNGLSGAKAAAFWNNFDDPNDTSAVIDGTTVSGMLFTPADRQRCEFFQAATQNLSKDMVSRFFMVTSHNEPLITAKMRHLLDALAVADDDFSTGGAPLPVELEQALSPAVSAAQSRGYFDETKDVLASRRRAKGSRVATGGPISGDRAQTSVDIAADQGVFVGNGPATSSTGRSFMGSAKDGLPRESRYSQRGQNRGPPNSGMSAGNFSQATVGDLADDAVLNPRPSSQLFDGYSNSRALAIVQEPSIFPHLSGVGGGAAFSRGLDVFAAPSTSDSLFSGGNNEDGSVHNFFDCASFYHLSGLLLLAGATPETVPSEALQSASTTGAFFTAAGGMPRPGFGPNSSAAAPSGVSATVASAQPLNVVLSSRPATLSYLDLRTRKMCRQLCAQNRRKMARDLTEALQQNFSQFLSWALRYCKTDEKQLRGSFRLLIDAALDEADVECGPRDDALVSGSVYARSSTSGLAGTGRSVDTDRATMRRLDVLGSSMMGSMQVQREVVSQSRQEMVTSFLFLVTRALLQAHCPGRPQEIGAGAFVNESNAEDNETPLLFEDTTGDERSGMIPKGNSAVPFSFFQNLVQKLFEFLLHVPAGAAKLSLYSALLALLPRIDRGLFKLPVSTAAAAVDMLLLDTTASPLAGGSPSLISALGGREQTSLAVAALSVLRFIIQEYKQVVTNSFPPMALFLQCMKQTLNLALNHANSIHDTAYLSAVQSLILAVKAALAPGSSEQDSGLPDLGEDFVVALYESGLLSLWMDGATTLLQGPRSKGDLVLLLLPFLSTICESAADYAPLLRDCENFVFVLLERTSITQDACQRCATEMLTLKATKLSTLEEQRRQQQQERNCRITGMTGGTMGRNLANNGHGASGAPLGQLVLRPSAGDEMLLSSEQVVQITSQVMRLASQCVSHEAQMLEERPLELTSRGNQIVVLGPPAANGYPGANGGAPSVPPFATMSQPLLTRRSGLVQQVSRDLLIACCFVGATVPEAVQIGCYLLQIFRDELTPFITGSTLQRVADMRFLAQQIAHQGSLNQAGAAHDTKQGLLGAVRNFFTGNRQTSPYNRPLAAPTSSGPGTALGVLLPPVSQHVGESAFAGTSTDLDALLDAAHKIVPLTTNSQPLYTADARGDEQMFASSIKEESALVDEPLDLLSEQLAYTILLYASASERRISSDVSAGLGKLVQQRYPPSDPKRFANSFLGKILR
ncbi:unnamed protein product [Amoebophrya sp. A25]|nr:unnamed protein product [Amoebophrya sp. A25]|eukprot:GSA25T00005067001.1